MEEGEEEIRTLFVSGLPSDVKDREIINLFRHYKGFEQAILKQSQKQPYPVAFVVFSERRDAEYAMEKLRGILFDPFIGVELRIEFANQNSKSGRRRRINPDEKYAGTTPPRKHQGMPPERGGRSETWGGATFPPGYVAGFPGSGFPGQHSPLWGFNGYPMMYSRDIGNSGTTIRNEASGERQAGPSYACTTLFVANAPIEVGEDKIKELFSKYVGYKQFLRHNDREDRPVYFVEFETIEDSTYALEKLQGYQMLADEGHDGLRIEYAKSKMGDSGGKKMIHVGQYMPESSIPYPEATGVFAYEPPQGERFVSYSVPFITESTRGFRPTEWRPGYIAEYPPGDGASEGSVRSLQSYIESREDSAETSPVVFKTAGAHPRVESTGQEITLP